MNDNLACVTWLENLINGLVALFLHPFSPLSRTNFNFNCLFTHKPYCYTDTTCHHQLKTHEIDHSSVILHDSISDGYLNFLQELPNSLIGIVTLVNPRNSSQIESSSTPTHIALFSRLAYTVTNIASYLKSRSFNVFLASQLILCSIILVHVIYDDTKRVVFYMKTSQNGQKIIKSFSKSPFLRPQNHTI